MFGSSVKSLSAPEQSTGAISDLFET